MSQTRHGKTRSSRQMTSSSKIAVSTLLAGLTDAVRADPLKIDIGKVQQCSPMDITWDTSKGQAPWTVTIAPIQHVPTTVELPSDYLSSTSWTYSWDVPSYSSSTNQLLVSVSDSTGSVSGVSKVQSIDSTSSKCSTISENLDFVFLVPTKDVPAQCESWKISWEEEKGASGLKYPVQVVVLPENEQPITYSITDEKTTSIDWTVALKEGTDFTLAVYDAGKSGTGGVGGVYTVGNGKSGSQCLGKIGAGGSNNLLGATTTLKPTATSNSKSGMSTQRASKTNGSHSSPTDSDDSSKDSSLDDSANSKSGGSTGAAVGGVFAALAVIAIAVAGVWYWRRKKSQEDGLYGVKAGGASRSSPNEGGGIGSILLAPFVAIGAWFSERSSGNYSPQVGYPRRQTNQFSTSFSGPNHNNNQYHQDLRNVGGVNGMMSERAGMSSASLMKHGSQFPPNSPLASPNGEATRDPFSSNPNSQHGHGSQQNHHSRGQSSSFGVPPIGLGQDLHSRKSGSIHARSVYSIVPDEALFPPPAPRVVPDDALVPPIRPGATRSATSSVKSANSDHGHSNNLNQPPLTPGAAIPGNPIKIEGAGVGTWKAGEKEREREREKIANRINNTGASPQHQARRNDAPSSQQLQSRPEKDNKELKQPKPSPSRREFSHEAQGSQGTDMTRSTNTNTVKTESSGKIAQPLGTDYIPPPVSTKSIFDPYSHMSQLYDAGIGREFWETDEDRRIMDGQVPEIPSEYQQKRDEEQYEEEQEEEQESKREDSKAPRIPSLLGRATSPFLLPGETEDDDGANNTNDSIPQFDMNQSTPKTSFAPNTNLPSLTAQSLSLNNTQQQQTSQSSSTSLYQHRNGTSSIDVKRNGDKILAGLQTELWNERRASARRPDSGMSEASSSGGLPYL